MQQIHLAMLIEWAGTLSSRKRLQKVVFLLQAIGCSLEADFYLHHYGPYSEDVARLTDAMVRQSFLVEDIKLFSESTRRKQYSYRLSETTSEQLRDLETSDQGAYWLGDLPKFEAQAKRLLNEEELRPLEYAATIVFFLQQNNDWDAAVQAAVDFKADEGVRDAESLARDFAKPNPIQS